MAQHLSRRSVRTRKSAIAEYWLDTAHGRERLPGNAALMDFGEPSCFACGWMATDPDADPVLWDVWDQAMLHRCHLIPHALGGPDTRENLVLLCVRCHRDAPDVRNPGYMLRWIGAREAWGAALARSTEVAMREAGVTEAQIARFNDQVGPTELLTRTRQLMSDWAVPVGGAFSLATLAACAVELVRNSDHGETRAAE